MGAWTETINAIAREQFGIHALLPVQQLVIHNILEALHPEEDKDCYPHQLVILPTGTGKSACFQIPACMIDAPVIIVYPLLSLIHDQLRRMHEAGIPAKSLIGGMSTSEYQDLTRAMLSGTCTCVLTNPETLTNEKHRQLFKKCAPALVIIDEAHCISKWGKSFRDSYLHIGTCIKALNPTAVVAFTATASEEVIADIQHLLFLDTPSYVLRGHSNRENITYSTYYTFNRDYSLVELFSAHPQRLLNTEDTQHTHSMLGTYPVYHGTTKIALPAIVFCATRSTCSRLALLLRDSLHKKEIFFYHAGLCAQEKQRIAEWFYHSNDGILVSTCAYGMGVDKSNIRTIIHYDAYTDIENFLQETGRAGRDTQPAQSIMLADISAMPSHEAIPCRREYFMHALGLSIDSCSGCDICMQYYPIVAEEYTILTCIVSRNPRCYTEQELKHRVRRLLQRKNLQNVYRKLHAFNTCIDILLEKGILKKGKWLWKHKLSINKTYKNSL